MGIIDSERVVVVCFCLHDHGRDSVESRDNSSGTKPFVVDKLHTNVVRDYIHDYFPRMDNNISFSSSLE